MARISGNETAIKRQSGAALIVFMLLIVVAASTILLNKLSRAAQSVENLKQTTVALKTARQALIGYALTYAENHNGQPQGYLPCPDTTGNGSAPGSCGGAGNVGKSVIGRLPWKTLKITPLRDGAGECLWYAVSGKFKSGTKSTLTSDTNGQFVIQDAAGNETIGSASADRVIAVVFASGPTLGNQDRTITLGTPTDCGSDDTTDPVNQAVNYLDPLNTIYNARGTDSSAGANDPGEEPLPTTKPSVFVQAKQTRDANEDLVFNDTLITIKPVDFTPVHGRMDRWVGERVRACLDQYGTDNGGLFPWVAELDGSGPPDYDDDAGVNDIGRVPFNLNDSGVANWPIDPVAFAGGSNLICFDGSNVGSDWFWWWWDEWREMVFYKVSDDYDPDGGATNPELKLDGTDAEYVIVVSGRKLGALTQVRTSNANKADISQYLEGNNSALPEVEFQTGTATNTFNDIACMNGICP